MRDLLGKKQRKKNLGTLIVLCLIVIPIFLAIPMTQSAYPDYDINMDGSCDLLDFVQISNHMGETGVPGWIRADVDDNGIIQILDMAIVSIHYGQSGWANDTSRIQKLSIAYGNAMGSTANQEFIANHFDLLDCPQYYTSHAANVKALNPNITIIAYYDAIFQDSIWSDWPYVNSHEDWFVHAMNGSRIERTTYPGQYLMNPNSGWSTYTAQKNVEFLQNNSHFDGVFADDVPLDLIETGYGFKVPYAQFEEGVLDNWSSWIIQYMQNTKTTIGDDIVLPNSYKYMQICQQATHATFWEGFIHSRSHAYNQNGYGTDGWSYGLLAIDLLHEQAELGHVIAVNSGCKDANLHPVEAKQWMMFTYACFSFAVEDVTKAYYSWQFFNTDATHGYYPEMDTNLGQPIGDYFHVSGTTRVYAREFTNYYVAANLDLLGTEDVTFTMYGASQTLSPRTAMFIQK